MKIIKILNDNQLTKIKELLVQLEFQDGKKTASGLSRDVKSNSEATPNSKAYKELQEFMTKILMKNVFLKRRFFPRLFSNPLINIYKKGDSYGRHYDNSYMDTRNGPIRKDFSFTIMLSEPNEYEGGALKIEKENITQEVKLGAGEMAIYPSNNIHSVLPILKGERVAYVGWMSSCIKDPLSLEVLNAFEDMYIELQKYDLSEDDTLMVNFFQNKLRHLLSD